MHWIEASALIGLGAACSGLGALVATFFSRRHDISPTRAQREEARRAASDAAARRRASNEEAQQRDAFGHLQVPLYMLAADGTIADATSGWLALLGYGREEVVGRPVGEFCPPHSRGATERDIARAMTQGGAPVFQQQFCRRNETIVDALVTAAATQRDGARWLVCSMTDVTGWRQQSSGRAARPHQAGLAGNPRPVSSLVVRDLNTALTDVVFNLDMLRMKLAEAHAPAVGFLDAASAGAVRAADLAGQPLAFTGYQQPALDPAAIIEGMQPVLRGHAGNRVALRLDLDENAGRCVADRAQFENAIVKLVKNASEAITLSGTIAITSSLERMVGFPGDTASAGSAAPGLATPELYVRVAVSDDGAGMTEQLRRRVFDPFFTTRERRTGAGLGLSDIPAFVENSGGTVQIARSVGGGTEVAMLLPHAAASRRPRVVSRSARRTMSHANGATALLVEDDAEDRMATVAVLKDLGFRVVEAVDALSALEVLEGSDRIAAVITDLVIPGTCDGVQLARVARARRPGTPVILMTRHPKRLRGQSLPQDIDVLWKPCDGVELATAMRRAMERASL